MLKNIVRLEVKVAEKTYQFLCDNDSPIAEVKEALFQITKIVAEIEANLEAAKKQAEESKPESVPQTENVETK